MTAAFIFASAVYLLAAGRFSGRWIHAEEELQMEFRSAGDGGRAAAQIWRITFDLKSGELVFYHEERSEEEEAVRPVPD